jgi:hypothetical protein
MYNFFTTDKIIAIGLIIVLPISIIMGNSNELPMAIVGGLVGYLGKRDNKKEQNDGK